MYYRGQLEVELSEPDQNATLSLQDGMGQTIDGTQEIEGTFVRFTPNTPLEPLQKYLANIEYCGSAEPVALPFETSDLGTPLDNGIDDVLYKTYAFDISSGRIAEPLGVGEALRSLLQNTFLIQVQDVQGEQLHIRSALSNAGNLEQNYCVPTLEDFPQIDFSQAPYFELVEQDISIQIGGYKTTIYSLSVSGVFVSDGSKFTQVQGRGSFDGRELYPIMSDFGFTLNSAHDFCDLLSNFDVLCLPCKDDAPYCFELALDMLEAYQIDLDIDPVCAENCHSECFDNNNSCDLAQTDTQMCD